MVQKPGVHTAFMEDVPEDRVTHRNTHSLDDVIRSNSLLGNIASLTMLYICSQVQNSKLLWHINDYQSFPIDLLQHMIYRRQ